MKSFHAARDGDVAAIQRCPNSGAKLSRTDENGMIAPASASASAAAATLILSATRMVSPDSDFIAVKGVILDEPVVVANRPHKSAH